MDTSNNPSIVLPCGHAFCTDCIIQVHGTAAQQNLRLGVDENERARCPGCRGELDLKKMIDWSTFRKVHMQEEGEEVKIKSGTMTADALAKLRKDARGSAASKKECKCLNVYVFTQLAGSLCNMLSTILQLQILATSKKTG